MGGRSSTGEKPVRFRHRLRIFLHYYNVSIRRFVRIDGFLFGTVAELATRLFVNG